MHTMTTTEPCPHCGGMGVRVIAPPPMPRGAHYARRGRTHGYESTYVSGCRCALCKAARRQAVARRKAAAVDLSAEDRGQLALFTSSDPHGWATWLDPSAVRA
jgi:hypothetical protein